MKDRFKKYPGKFKRLFLQLEFDVLLRRKKFLESKLRAIDSCFDARGSDDEFVRIGKRFPRLTSGQPLPRLRDRPIFEEIEAMKKFTILAVLCTSPLIGLPKRPRPQLFSAERFVPGATPRNSIIAVVEGWVITEEEVRRIMLPSMASLIRGVKSKQELSKQTAQLANDIIQKLIDDIIIVDHFKDEGYQIPKTVIENQYKNAIQRILVEIYSRFLRYLRERNQTVRQYREELRTQDYGAVHVLSHA